MVSINFSSPVNNDWFDYADIIKENPAVEDAA